QRSLSSLRRLSPSITSSDLSTNANAIASTRSHWRGALMATTMTERDDDFLKRWSRRKRAAASDAKRAKEAADEPAREGAPAAPAPTEAEAFDPATLPPIDSINAITDVRDFLRAGVPAELTRAALRRAWSADPAIRDFIGLAENSWDFTAPDAMPGFGPLNASPEEIRQLVDRIISKTTDLADASAAETGSPPESIAKSAPQPEVRAASGPPPAPDGHETARASQSDQVSDQSPVDVAMQQE